jgi:hypothetical protein
MSILLLAGIDDAILAVVFPPFAAPVFGFWMIPRETVVAEDRNCWICCCFWAGYNYD